MTKVENLGIPSQAPKQGKDVVAPSLGARADLPMPEMAMFIRKEIQLDLEKLDQVNVKVAIAATVVVWNPVLALIRRKKLNTVDRPDWVEEIIECHTESASSL